VRTPNCTKLSIGILMPYLEKDGGDNAFFCDLFAEVIEKTEGESNIMTHKERKIFQERAEPCPLSSSLYYGGPEDMYIHSSSTPSLDSFPIFKKDAVEGDPNGSYLHSASRGNWWQGSLYY
ncbi:hypothetical protein ACR2V7_25510, partial [Klebsiella pneumoniae]